MKTQLRFESPRPPGIILAVLLLAIGGARATAGPQQCQYFDLGAVKLLDSPFKQAMDRNAKYLLSLSPDRLLAGIRRNAGLEPKGRRYGGWESGGVAGHSLGHYLTAVSQQYCATGDPRFLARANYIVSELAACQQQDPSGFLATIPLSQMHPSALRHRDGRLQGWVPWYVMHKLFAGLRDAHLLCGSEQAKTVLLKLTDWAKSVTDPLTAREMEIMLGPEHGGMAEVLADVYAITDNPDHLQLVRRFCHRLVMDPLAHGDDRLAGLHANTQIPKITGAARMYELTGEEYFRNVSVSFWNMVTTDHTYCIGGNSDREHFFPPAEFRHHLTTGTCETCNTYNMLKLTEHLFRWSPESRWMDYYERALYNQILGSQDPDTGMFTYFQSLKPGGFKLYSHPTKAFWCCVGTGMENHSKFGTAIYARSADALWVNLFIPSELSWTGQSITVCQQTSFPESDTSRLTLRTEEPADLTIHVRSPGWLAGPLGIRVNGQAVPITLTNGYAQVRRTWHDGDAIELHLPMALRTEPLPHTPHVLSLLYGPVVLAAELGTEGLGSVDLYQTDHNENIYRFRPVPVVPYCVAPESKVLEHVEPDAGKPLTFRTRNLVQPEDVTLIPYWQLHHQRYSVYFETFTPAGWEQKKAELLAAAAARRAFEARIVDDVKTGEQQSERNHGLRGIRTFSGGSAPKWRDARDGGWFEYTLQVLPDKLMELLVTYWGSDGGNREFHLMIDGERIATEKLTASKPNEFFDRRYSVPVSLSRGKPSVVLRFQAKPGNIAGGVFGIRMMRTEE